MIKKTNLLKTIEQFVFYITYLRLQGPKMWNENLMKMKIHEIDVCYRKIISLWSLVISFNWKLNWLTEPRKNFLTHSTYINANRAA